MRIKTNTYINARTQDGREFVADKDAVVEIDDEDVAVVGLAKSLIMSGQATHHGDAGGVEAESTAAEATADPADETDGEDDADEGTDLAEDDTES